MIDEKNKLLIHRAIDGEVSESEREELNRLLESSPEASQFYAQIQRLSSLPSQLPPANAPSGMKDKILSVIAGSHQPARARVSNPRTIGALVGSLFTPRLAYGLAAGLVLGISIGSVAFRETSGQLNPLDLSGTILAGSEAKTLKRLDADTFVHAQARGRLAVDASSGLAYIQVEIESAQEVSVVLDYDPSAYTLRALEQQSPRTTNLVAGEGQVRASHVGQNRYLFVLGPATESTASPVILRVESNGVMYERELKLNDASGS